MARLPTRRRWTPSQTPWPRPGPPSPTRPRSCLLRSSPSCPPSTSSSRPSTAPPPTRAARRRSKWPTRRASCSGAVHRGWP
eukprot:scaffold36173_cov73-Isochrysis_galbana.AAC.1